MGAQVAWTSTVGVQWRHTRRRNEVCGVNLDGECACGVDLDSGCAVEAHVEEERGTDVEAINVASRRTQRRSGRQWMCGREMIGLGFRGSGILKRRIVLTGGVDYVCTPVTKTE
jgi:hypothetical protein